MTLPTEDSDAWQTLIENARQGCDESLGVIADEVRSYLKTIAESGIANGLQSKFSSSDVVQISLIEAQESITDFRGSTEAEIKKWLKRIVIHNLTDEARRFTRTRSRDVKRELQADDVAALTPVTGEKTPSWHARSEETKQQILAAIDRLPSKSVYKRQQLYRAVR